MRILIVKLGSIGDVVHTLPTLAAIKKALPDADISWVVEQNSAEILRNNHLLSDLIEIDTKALRHKAKLGKTLLAARSQLRTLRASEFDLAIDFQGLLKSAAIAKLSKTRKRYGNSKENLREPASRFLLTHTIGVKSKQKIVRRNLKLAEGSLAHYLQDQNFQLDSDNLVFPIFTDDSHVEEAGTLSRLAGENFAILNPAGGWVTKLWHAEKFGQLADMLWEQLGITSVISTAPSEIELAEKALASSVSGKTISAQPSLKGFYEFAKHARVYVGGDTAPTHMAVAANCPVVGIFGPTEWWRNGSVNKDDLCVERNDIDCRVDCHRRKCDKWICMDISIETVFTAVKDRLESKPQL
ncbi:MAG: glycosyltransferase family 9 protein [Pyrinomonadaceae bacterium]|nr:glycosyltransferase family 9 protein [Pyrinomonadaceae bacterium]